MRKMIPFDFEYYRPDSSEEAVNLFEDLQARGKRPLYFGGGTEIISFSRLYQLYPGAVIDIKEIPECNVLEQSAGHVVIGAAVTLSRIQESGVFPLLSQCGGRVADHTIRNKITLGGNICARIPYREAVLPLLAGDAEVVLQGRNGKKQVPINEVFNQYLRLDKGELLLQVKVAEEIIKLPCASYKTTTDGEVGYPQDRIGYPVVSAAGIKKEGRLRVAVSGASNYPVRSAEIEEILNNTGLPLPGRIDRAVRHLPIISDMEGSASYREFVLRNIFSDMLKSLECC